jgi:hypothetical protein
MEKAGYASTYYPMKRESIGHTKMKRLCRRLDLALWQSVGLLESIWHLTARQTPRGDIGKLSDEDIALGIDYRGDESRLIDALIGSGWLDRDPGGRLVVHDWADHADDAVHMRLARARLHFVGGQAPKTARLPGKEREAADQFYAASRGTHAVPSPNPRETDDRPTASERQARGIATPCVPPEPAPAPAPGTGDGERVHEAEVETAAPANTIDDQQAFAAVAAVFREAVPLADDKAVSDLIRACSKQRPDISTEEIAWCVRVKSSSLRNGRFRIEQPGGRPDRDQANLTR